MAIVTINPKTSYGLGGSVDSTFKVKVKFVDDGPDKYFTLSPKQAQLAGVSGPYLNCCIEQGAPVILFEHEVVVV